jgi:hypothetical protein
MQWPGSTEGERVMAENAEPLKTERPDADQPEMSEDEIDRNLDETFPASDPPSWTLGTDHGDESPDTNTEAETKK